MRASANHDKWAHICNEIYPAGTDGEDDDGEEEDECDDTEDKEGEGLRVSER